MDQAIARFRRGAPFGLLFLDLDRFKAVNDTLGHGAGDRLLCAVAERIANCIRETDTAARLGGDEFAIVLADTAGEVNLEQVAQRLIDSIKEPYAIDGRQIVIGVSIGGSLAGQGVTTETIVAEADLAMYDAKEAGRGVFRLFERDLRTRVDEKRVLENELRHALAAGELEVHYQPLLNLQDNRVVSFEALVRWRHPVQGMIPPARFLPVAEECGIIGQLGLWVLRTACQDAAGWPVPVKLAVNVSPLQLKDPTLFASVVKILEATGLAPRRLELELTEASVLDNSEQTLTALRQLREIGASIAFDDFGTGYSSLSSLLRFPFDKIKIDRSFIDDSERSPSAAAIVRAVVGIGTSLNLVTTGEGIETREQLARLRGYGCTEVQGFLFSPARPNSEVPRLLRELEGSAIDALQLATRG
jgi:diguanylate cyclase (GGDEF)-like protein